MTRWIAILLFLVPAKAFVSPLSPFRPRRQSLIQQLQFPTKHRYKFKHLFSVPEEEPANISTEEVEDDTLEDAVDDASSKESTLAAGIFGLTKAMLGTGVLALPGGLAAVSDFPSMLWPANALMLTMGALSGYTFSLYGRLSFMTKAKTLDGLWSTVFQRRDTADGASAKSSTLPISIANFAYCYGCCLTFLLVIGDALMSLTQLASTGATPWWVSRQALILTVATTCLWPLCNLKSLQALAPVSILGVLGCLVSTAFVVWRCPAVFKGSPYAAKAAATVAAAQFSTYNRSKGPAPLVLFSMGCVALMAHFSAPDFLDSFQSKNKGESDNHDQTSADRRSIRKYNQMTIAAYALVAIVNAITLSFGFLTFGGKCAGIILNNYSASDLGAAVSRFLTAVSVGGSFPILFAACRSSAYDLFGVSRKSRRKLTAILLASLTAIAMVVQDAGFVVSFNGALMGTAILYIFPAAMFLRWTKGEVTTPIRRAERLFCRFLMGFGTVAAIIGGATSILNSYFPHLLI